MISYDCARKLTENDKLKAVKSKLKSHSDNHGTFMVTIKKTLLFFYSYKTNLIKNVTGWVEEL